MIKAAVFDLDHTLYDRYATLKVIEKKLRRSFKINPALSDDEIAAIMIESDKNFVHLGWDKLQEHIINHTDLFEESPAYDEYRKFIMGEFMHTAVKFPFARPVLEALRRDGFLLGLITNGRAELQTQKLKLLELSDCFDRIFISGVYGVAKPSPEPFRMMAGWLSVKPCEIAYIGDNPENDVEASRQAGCLPIFVNTTKTWVFPEIKKADYTVLTVAEIPKLLKRINSDM